MIFPAVLQIIFTASVRSLQKIISSSGQKFQLLIYLSDYIYYQKKTGITTLIYISRNSRLSFIFQWILFQQNSVEFSEKKNVHISPYSWPCKHPNLPLNFFCYFSQYNVQTVTNNFSPSLFHFPRKHFRS